MAQRWRLRWIAVGAWAALWLFAGVYVRVMLAWTDAQPYEPDVIEPLYRVFATVAGLAVIAGPALAGVVWWRTRSPAGEPEGNEETPAM